MGNMVVQINDERIQKDISVSLGENVVLKGTITVRNNAVSEGNLDVQYLNEKGDVTNYTPLGFRVQDGELTFAPGRMGSSMLGKVYEAITAIEELFKNEIEALATEAETPEEEQAAE